LHRWNQGIGFLTRQRQTNYLFAKAESIGPSTKELCKLLFEEEGRPGQRRMQGVVNLVRHYEACYIEEAATKAIKVDLRKLQSPFVTL